ncbi:elongation factor G, partial [bacterium]|nr:elongation factor G [bacterium]
PEKFQGDVVGDVTRRRGMIVSTDMREDGSCEIVSEIPLAETFGYETDLRSMTQGQGSSTMELAKYAKVPSNVQMEIVEERNKEALAAAK